MEQIYSNLLKELSKELDDCWRNDLPEVKRFENCFWIADKFCKNIERQVLQKGFANEDEEIRFFKEIKPQFAALVEFFVIATEALWFVGSEVVCSKAFWKEETDKYKRFRERQHPFVSYYEAGETHLDAEFFLKASEDSISEVQSILFDESHHMHSRKDWLVRSYLANKMYHGFAQEKLKTIESAKQQGNDLEAAQTGGKGDSFSASLLNYLK